MRSSVCILEAFTFASIQESNCLSIEVEPLTFASEASLLSFSCSHNARISPTCLWLGHNERQVAHTGHALFPYIESQMGVCK